MNAATALVNAGVDVDEIRELLPSVEPHFVSVFAASEFARRFWAEGIVAVTMPWALYVTPATFERIDAGDEPRRFGRLVVHELVHLHQYRSAGAVPHVVRYCLDYLRGRMAGLGHWDAYLDVAAEVEARSLAGGIDISQGPR